MTMNKDEQTSLTDQAQEGMSDNLQDTPTTEVDNASDESHSADPRQIGSQSSERRWLPYVITASVLAAITLLIAWAEKGYTTTNTWVLLGSWGDSFAISGVMGVALGALVWASNGGVFDIFAYGGRVFVRKFKKDYKDHKYPSYYDYREAKKSRKRSFLYMIIVGSVFLLIGGILLIVYRVLTPDM